MKLNLNLKDHLVAGLKTIAAFDGKAELDMLRELVEAGIHARMESMSTEWINQSELANAD